MLENVGYDCDEESGCVGVKIYWTADILPVDTFCTNACILAQGGHWPLLGPLVHCTPVWAKPHCRLLLCNCPNREGRLRLQAQIAGARWIGVGVNPSGGGMEGTQAFIARQPDGSADAFELHQYVITDPSGATTRIGPEHRNYTAPEGVFSQVMGAFTVMFFESAFVGTHMINLERYDTVLVAFGHDTAYALHRGHQTFMLNWLTGDVMDSGSETPPPVPTKQPTAYPTKEVVSWAPTTVSPTASPSKPKEEEKTDFGLIFGVLAAAGIAGWGIWHWYVLTRLRAKKTGRSHWTEAVEPLKLALTAARVAAKRWLKDHLCKGMCRRKRKAVAIEQKSTKKHSKRHGSKRKSKKRRSSKHGSKRKSKKRRSSKHGSKRSKRSSKRKKKKRRLRDLVDAVLHKGSRVRIVGMGEPEGLKGVAQSFDEAEQKWLVLVDGMVHQVPIPVPNLEIVKQNKFGCDDDDPEYESDMESEYPEDIDENLGVSAEEWLWLQTQVPIMYAKHICCAQTHKLMKCPATVLTTNKVYERDFILDWVARNKNDPLHLDPLELNQVVPNKKTWKIIRKFVKETRRDKGKKGGKKGEESETKVDNDNGKDSRSAATSDAAEDYRNEQAAREREHAELMAEKRRALQKASDEMKAVEDKMRSQMRSPPTFCEHFFRSSALHCTAMALDRHSCAVLCNFMTGLRSELRASRALRKSKREADRKSRRSAGPRSTTHLLDEKREEGGGAIDYLMRSAGGGGIDDDDDFLFEGD